MALYAHDDNLGGIGRGEVLRDGGNPHGKGGLVDVLNRRLDGEIRTCRPKAGCVLGRYVDGNGEDGCGFEELLCCLDAGDRAGDVSSTIAQGEMVEG